MAYSPLLFPVASTTYVLIQYTEMVHMTHSCSRSPAWIHGALATLTPGASSHRDWHHLGYQLQRVTIPDQKFLINGIILYAAFKLHTRVVEHHSKLCGSIVHSFFIVLSLTEGTRILSCR